MLKLLFGLTFLLLGFASFIYFETQEINVSVENDISNEREYLSQVKLNEIKRQINNNKLDVKNVQEDLSPYLALRRAVAFFDEAESNLFRGLDIQRSVAIPQAEEQEMHPLTRESLQKAAECYEKARKEVDNISENKDVAFNYNLNYIKGEIYYRYLQYMSDQDNAQELFNQTLNCYKNALKYRMADINTVVNIELLIKNKSAFIGDAANPQAKKKQMLNIKKAGVSKGSGN